MKLILPRIVGTWCKEFECWPEHHPGCARHTERGCSGCEYAEKRVIVDGDENNETDITDARVQ